MAYLFLAAAIILVGIGCVLLNLFEAGHGV